MEELERLKDNISAALHLTYSEVLVQRAWLIHWGLFVYFNHPQVCQCQFCVIKCDYSKNVELIKCYDLKQGTLKSV